MVKALKSYGLCILRINIVIGTTADNNNTHEPLGVDRSKSKEKFQNYKVKQYYQQGTLKNW